MKTLALVIALAACAGATAESIPGVRSSELKPVMLVPPAPVTAAVAQAQVFPESSAAQSAEPGECRIGGAPQVEDAAAEAPVFDKVALGKTDGMSPSVALEDAKHIQEVEPRKTGAMPEPKFDTDCTLVGIYAKRRMLSGPWSASRRLEAARIRGDADEAKRMEAMLDDLLGKAILQEEK